MNLRCKEQIANLQQLTDDIEKVKSLISKESKFIEQQTQQNEKFNDEIRNVANLTSLEESKLARGQIDE